jgi:hypothetical protein
VAVRRLRLAALQILGVRRTQGAHQILDVRRVHQGRRVQRIRPVPSEWDALAVGLRRIGLERPFRLFRQGSAAPRPEVRMPACDQRLVCRAAAPFQSPPPEEPEERSTLCIQVVARFAASPCAAVRVRRPLRRLWIRRRLCQLSLRLPLLERQERAALLRPARSPLRTLSLHRQPEEHLLRVA